MNKIEHPVDGIYDLAVIGGGVNGCGIARDAAGRGLSVVLVEQGDLAQATSSASTKLIHGGLRYLEYYDFRLVRESLVEREVLLGAMPHIARPMRFVLPHHKGLRLAWFLRLSLFIYDHLGGRKILPATRTLDLRTDPAGTPLKSAFVKAFEYSDGWVDDARLVVLNARDAADKGASIRTRTRCDGAERDGQEWQVRLTSLGDGKTETVRARALVNAGGPWVGDVLSQCIGSNAADRIRLVRGSHIVVPRLFDHDRAYIFQQSDGRAVFAIGYETDFTLIGTTDIDHDGDPSAPVCTPEEADYLCAAVSDYFDKPVRPEDIVWTYSGVRPLYDDGVKPAHAATRDYVLELDANNGAAPLISVFGGKITTFRRLAETVMDKFAPYFDKLGESWTLDAALPGGEIAVDGLPALAADLRTRFQFLDEPWAMRLVQAYGTDVVQILGEARSAADLGQSFGATLTQSEVAWLMRREWAKTAEDVLWRRSKLGLRLSQEEQGALEAWMSANRPDDASVSVAANHAG